ncbi:MAG: putative diheme cytochrome c-553 [Myxococcaceae bacterium]|nr:putative diheme cytochrome c-553 [Myxococcaceae bacterium]
MPTNPFRMSVIAIGLMMAACSSDDSAGPDAGRDAGTAPLLDASSSLDAALLVPGAGHDASAPLLGTVERGEYLVDHVLMCGVCHTPSLPNGEPDMTKYLAGSRSYDFTDVDRTIVTVNAENLTSHDPEGLHSWTDDQIRRAITKGIDDEKIAMYPIMPYPEYALLTQEDVDSIVKYLRSVPPNDNVVPADFPYFDQHDPVPAVDDSKIPHTTLAASDPLHEAAERGRYIAKTACLNCHTEEISSGVPNLSKAFAGGKKYTFIRGKPVQTSTNITPDATGLATWSISDIATAIQTNQEKGTGRTLCNTHPGGAERLGKMTDADRQDLATYIHTLPPVANGPFQCVQ